MVEILAQSAVYCPETPQGKQSGIGSTKSLALLAKRAVARKTTAKAFLNMNRSPGVWFL